MKAARQAPTNSAEMRLQTARAWLRASEIRRGIITDQLGADPAWDILLDLYVNRQLRRPVPVTSACLAAGVPTSTAMRWIEILIERGWIARMADPHDARRCLLSLTQAGVELVERALDAVVDSDRRYGLSRLTLVKDIDREL